MLKPKNAKKLKQRAFTITEYHENLLETLIEKRGYTSYSEIVRDGIEELYEHYFPPYRQETVAGKIKERKLNEQEEKVRLASLPPEDYAKAVGVEIFDDNNGNRVAVMYEFANSALRFASPDWMKDKLVNDPEWLEIHLTKCKTKTVMDKILENKEEYERKGLIINEVAPTQNERNQRDHQPDS